MSDSSCSSKRKRLDKVAETSRMNRAKKKKEYEELKRANFEMKQEQEELKATLDTLNHQIEHQIPTSTLALEKENHFLREEIHKHKEFIDKFARLIRGCGTLSGQRQLCEDGVESAHAYVQALMVESQSKWKQLRFPEGIHIPLEGFCLRYRFQENFLGFSGGRRLNLRLDFKIPEVTAQELSDFYWYVWNSPEEQKQLYGVKALELERVDMPDKNTVLLYNRKTWNSGVHSRKDKSWREKDQDVVFICNRSEAKTPKSVLSLPVGSVDEEPLVGNTNAITIALTSTRTTHETFKACKIANKANTQDCVDHITSIISQGATCWDDDDGCARMIMVLSYPEEYRWVDVSFTDVVEKESPEFGVAGLSFAMLLLGIASRIRNVVGKGLLPPSAS